VRTQSSSSTVQYRTPEGKRTTNALIVDLPIRLYGRIRRGTDSHLAPARPKRAASLMGSFRYLSCFTRDVTVGLGWFQSVLSSMVMVAAVTAATAAAAVGARRARRQPVPRGMV